MSGSGAKPPKVLLVEDEASFFDALRVGLGREGFAIDVARDGREALDRFAAGAPDIILLDVMLPRISGIDVCREILGRARAGERALLGVLLESNLLSGAQPWRKGASLQPGVSITDPCAGWEETRQVLTEAAEMLARSA